MVNLQIVKEWFERDFHFSQWKRDVEVIEDTPERFRFRIYTDNNSYSIIASTRGPDHSYLGCGASTRKPRAGEDWTRGNDLADGKLEESVWRQILADIVSYEMVKVHHREDAVRAVELPAAAPCTA